MNHYQNLYDNKVGSQNSFQYNRILRNGITQTVGPASNEVPESAIAEHP